MCCYQSPQYASLYTGLVALEGCEIIDLAFGPDFWIAVTVEGELLACGTNTLGQLGQGHIRPLEEGYFQTVIIYV